MILFSVEALSNQQAKAADMLVCNYLAQVSVLKAEIERQRKAYAFLGRLIEIALFFRLQRKSRNLITKQRAVLVFADQLNTCLNNSLNAVFLQQGQPITIREILGCHES